MLNIIELLEEKRNELGDTFKAFAYRFPGSDNYQKYLNMRHGQRANFPSEWLPEASKLLGIPEGDIARRFREDRARAKKAVIQKRAAEIDSQRLTDARQKARDREDANTRLRLIVALSSMLDPKQADEVIRSFPRPGYQDYLYPYTYNDHNFWTLAYYVRKQAGYDDDREGLMAVTRQAIENIARDYKDKVRLAISGFAAAGYMYTREEMPELHAICHYGI